MWLHHRFQQSGQGNCATDEKVADAIAAGEEKGVDPEVSVAVFSADFHNFTLSNLVMPQPRRRSLWAHAQRLWGLLQRTGS